jgi:hypothetical protein
MEEEKAPNFEVEETPTHPLEQPSENTNIKEFKLPSWWLKFSDSCSRLSKRLQRSFDRLLFALDEEQKEKLKKNLYYLVCFIGFVGYAVFTVLVLGAWLLLDLIIGVIKFQKEMLFRKNDGSLTNEGTNFALGGIVTILQGGKAIIAFIVRRIGWGDFDFSRNGIIRVIRNLFKEVRPSQTTFRFGVLTLIIVGYMTVTNLINYIQVQNSDYYEGGYYEGDDYNNTQPLQPESSITPQPYQFYSAPTLTPSIIPSPILSPSDQTNATIIGEPGYKNIRSGPGTNYSEKHIAYPGDRVQILESSTDISGYIWYKVYFPKSGAEGWIAGQLLSPD